MGNSEKNIWLARSQQTLSDAVETAVRIHVLDLRARRIDFYGYALFPGEPEEISHLVVVTNNLADIKVPEGDRMYDYYRFSVDEWKTWEQDRFGSVDALLEQANKEFATLHQPVAGSCEMDAYEIAHSESLLAAILAGLEQAKRNGVFGAAEPFLALWISDSDHPIMAQSVSRLNSAAVAEIFLKEFS